MRTYAKLNEDNIVENTLLFEDEPIFEGNFIEITNILNASIGFFYDGEFHSPWEYDISIPDENLDKARQWYCDYYYENHKKEYLFEPVEDLFASEATLTDEELNIMMLGI
jgi:hypothetical protein